MKKIVLTLCILVTLSMLVSCAKPGTQQNSQTGSKVADSDIKYPTKPVEIIVSGAAGGGTDLTARTLAPFLEKELGISVVVSNLAGAGGVEAFTKMATTKPDGHSIGLVTLPAMPLAAVNGQLKIDPTNDYIYLGQLVYNSSTVAISAKGKYKTLKEVIDALKKEPESVTMSVTGPGTLKALVAQSIEEQASVKFRLIAFTGGAECITQALGGHADLTGATVAEAMPFVGSGDLKVLAVSGSSRNPKLPDVPTFSELGYNLAVGGSTHGFVVPKGTDERIVKKLREVLKKIAQDKGFIDQAVKANMDLAYADEKAVSELVASQMKSLKKK